MNRHCSRRHLPDRPGHTLMELTVALPIMAMLALGMASAVKLAASSIPDGTSVSDSTLTAARAMDRFAGEVAFATAIGTDVTSGTAARQVTFVIPDRDGQTPATETVAYSWSGIPGDPLLRIFNGTTATAAVNVHEFGLTYEKRRKPAADTATTTSAESPLIFSFWLTNVADSPITTSNWCGQYFLPLLSPDVVGWDVTKVQFLAKLNGSTTGQTAVQIRTANNRLPTSTVLDQQILLENTLTYFHTVKTLAFSNVPMQSRNQGLCLVLKLAADSPSGYAQYREGGTPNAYFVSTTDGGATWAAAKSSSLQCIIYGTVQTESETSASQYYLANVGCRMRLGGAGQSRLTTSIRILNEPQVNGP